MEKIRASKNKIGFLAQYGYFKASGKFFFPKDFVSQDIKYLSNKLDLDCLPDVARTYKSSQANVHKHQILKMTGWSKFDKAKSSILTREASLLSTRQHRPRIIFNWVLSFLFSKKIEVPAYYPLARLVTKALSENENILLDIIGENIESSHRIVLDHLVETYEDGSSRKQLSPITSLKRLNQSPGAKKLNKSIEEFEKIKSLNVKTKGIMDCLNLPSEVISQYADYTIRSTKFQLSQLKPNKRYLYMIAFIANQFSRMHDALIDHFVQAVQASNHSALALFRENHFASRKGHGSRIYPFFHSLEKDVFTFINGLENTLEANHLGDENKILEMKVMFANYKKTQPEREEQMAEIRDDLFKASKEVGFYDALEAKSRALQRKVTKIVCSMEHDPGSENKRLILAINHFRYKLGKVSETCPMGFLSTEERNLLFDVDRKFRVSLYKIMLFRHITASIKSGTLNMKHSIKYRSLEEYMLPQEEWVTNEEEMLERASMTHLLDFDAVLNKLKDILHKQYETTNENILSGKNDHVKFNQDHKIIVATPKVYKMEKRAPDLFAHLQYVPIQEVLLSIHEQTGFLDVFEHFSPKYHRHKPELKNFMAAIIALGCNVGTGKIQKTARGLEDVDLNSLITLYFSHHNVQAANDKILKYASKLDITNLQRSSRNILQTSSDGQKYGVGVDSLNARYSFKYFGKGAGSTDYGFIDERQLLWYSTMFSSAEREATYVIDGLTYGDGDFFDGEVIHSTDTHGYSESVFATSWLLGFNFSPRIKNLKKQRIFSFLPKKEYKDKGYKVLPYGMINISLIRKYWHEILRFIATIKLKESKASELFGRLSSYSKDNPFHRALKEFGKIIKSIFLLKYIDDLKLRQAIEKQLNKVEQSNKFAKAVFFDHSHEFMVGTKEEQDVVSACKRLIQNSIICWNYMYMSQRLIDTSNEEDRRQMIEAIRKKMAIAWRHINFLGEYDFTNEIENRVVLFDPLKIRNLKIN